MARTTLLPQDDGPPASQPADYVVRADELESQLNLRQREAVQGGTGKTFLYRAVYSKLRCVGKNVICVASSGVAALLLPHGSTAHSKFRIPLKLTEASTCAISLQSGLAAELRAVDLIIWDEVPMQHRFAFEAVHQRWDSPPGGGGRTQAISLHDQNVRLEPEREAHHSTLRPTVDDPLAGHFGQNRTEQLLRRKFHWIDLQDDASSLWKARKSTASEEVWDPALLRTIARASAALARNFVDAEKAHRVEHQIGHRHTKQHILSLNLRKPTARARANQTTLKRRHAEIQQIAINKSP
ncbi:hypothetical protein BP00DRAFT_456891 [Aspergillus indologenus CBS 114.80]|uniref:ATP-dependent DNA helicase n=1 Tax=Aspergillus indologenus CBS 114.80 TaxID=1450541 RepID=A0A2V5IBG3_9EURO|nr:hypothetical protein BP00DRAFT_456891 [Aspergillus indologenus CBS 114.80]